MKQLIQIIKQNKKKCTIIMIAIICYLLILLLSGLELSGADRSVQKNNDKKHTETKKVYTEKPEEKVTDEPYPERHSVEYPSGASSASGTSSAQANTESCNFTIDNMDLIDEENEFPQNQVENVMNAIQEYLDSNSFEEKIKVLSIAEETVYYDKEQFGMTLCLNDSMLNYVKVVGNGEVITCEDENYGEPPLLLKEDKEAIEKIHEQTSYQEKIEYDFEDFPYTEEDMENLIGAYYADMSGNYYENYQKYGQAVKNYMEKELEYFNYSYSTYKYNTDLLKKELSNGNKEMFRNGKIKADVKGYLSLYATNIVAKVELTMSDQGKQEKQMVWVTMINDGKQLLILPEDRSVEQYWEYKYQY